MLFDLAPIAFALLSCGAVIFLFHVEGHWAKLARALAFIINIVLTARYAIWRITTSLPQEGNIYQHLWAYLFTAVEMGTLASAVLTYIFLSRTISRSEAASAPEGAWLQSAPTDVFIATYNESLHILERTMVGALAISHPDLRVWILDDGNRLDVKELAQDLGVHYVARTKRDHAKAGNVNHGVKIALKTGRRPSFFLLLDADFVANRRILERVLPLFHDPAVGIVQTPQHFFNPDPVQSNLLCTSVLPDEQRLFFNVLLPAKDAWGTAFCCGTSAVFRTEAFERAGGMSTETVTEDMLTSFRFNEVGYRTIFLNERLSLGLAPESLTDFVSQRSRWCLGAMQQIFTPWSFLGRAKITLMNRLSFLDTILYWCFGALFKLLLLIGPPLYWFTGTTAMHATTDDLLYQLLPMVLVNLVAMNAVSGFRTLPVISDVTQMLTMSVVLRTVVTALVRPFGRPFKVTDKGHLSNGVIIHWNILWPFMAMAGITALGVLTQMVPGGRAHGVAGYDMTILWSLLNILMLALAGAVCVELPHRRIDERFDVNEPAVVYWKSQEESADSDAQQFPAILENLSLGGAALRRPEGWTGLAEMCDVVIEGGQGRFPMRLGARVVATHATLLRLEFLPCRETRHALIRKLFTGDYHKDVEQVKIFRVAIALGKALFAA